MSSIYAKGIHKVDGDLWIEFGCWALVVCGLGFDSLKTNVVARSGW